MAQYRTRAPKGVFIYYSAEEMESDRLRWTVDAIIEKRRALGWGSRETSAATRC